MEGRRDVAKDTAEKLNIYLKYPQKLRRLGTHGKCVARKCKCSGWQSIDKVLEHQEVVLLSDEPIPPRYLCPIKVRVNDQEHREEIKSYQELFLTLNDPCKGCSHELKHHVSAYQGKPAEFVKLMLSYSVDAAYIKNEQVLLKDEAEKQVYDSVLKVFYQAIASVQKHDFQTLNLVWPRAITIRMVLRNFCLLSKKKSEKEGQLTCAITELLIKNLNQRTFRAVELKSSGISTVANHWRIIYVTWLVVCHLPKYCHTIPKPQEVVDYFGVDELLTLLPLSKKEMTENVRNKQLKISINHLDFSVEQLKLYFKQLKQAMVNNYNQLCKGDLSFVRHLIPKNKLFTDPEFIASPLESLKNKVTAVPDVLRSDKERLKDGGILVARQWLEPRPPRSLRKRRHDSSSIDQKTEEKKHNSGLMQVVHELGLNENDTGELVSKLTDCKKLEGLKSRLRDHAARSQERKGEIEFYMLSYGYNSSHQEILWLAQAQNIFHLQIPSMPAFYILNKVFDPSHRTLIAVGRDGNAFGAINFRMFPQQGYSEMVFCAVLGTSQVKGYGGHMMNHLKDYLCRHGVLELVTYADKNATTFFVKQNFKHMSEACKRKFDGYIRHYTAAILMGCNLDPSIIYTELSERRVECQHIKDTLIERYGSLCSQRHFLYENSPGHRRYCKQKIRLEDIPGLSKNDIATARNRDFSSTPDTIDDLKRPLGMVLERLRRSKDAEVFLLPAAETDAAAAATELPLIVERPIDLKTIETKLDDGLYRSRDQFVDDVQMMFDSCRRCSSATAAATDHEPVQMACNRLQVLFYKYMQSIQFYDKQPCVSSL